MWKLGLALVVAGACGSGEVALLQAAPARAGAPAVATAPELCRALVHLSGAERLAALPDGVTVTGAVVELAEFGEDGGVDLVLRCDGVSRLHLGFADDGAALRAARPAVGATVVAHCLLGGRDGAAFYLRGCALTPPPAGPAGG